MATRKRQANGAKSSAAEQTSDILTAEDIRKCEALMLEAGVELDKEVLIVLAKLVKLNVSPDAIYQVLKQVMPYCGTLKKFRLKPKSSVEQ